MNISLIIRRPGAWTATALLCLVAGALPGMYGPAAQAQEDEEPVVQTTPPQPPLRSRDRYHPAHTRLRGMLFDGRRLRKTEEVNAPELIRTLQAVSRIIDEERLWVPAASEEAANYGWRVASDFRTGLAFALELARTKEEKRDWMLRRQAITLRTMNFLLDTRERHPDYFQHAWKDGTPLAALTSDLMNTRSTMVELGLLKPDEWGMLYGLSWIDEPGAVMVRDGVVFVEASLLRRLIAREPYFTQEHRMRRPEPPRQARIPVGTPAQAGPRRGYKDSEGRTYLPVEEFYRQGELGVAVYPTMQLVQIEGYLGRSEPDPQK